MYGMPPFIRDLTSHLVWADSALLQSIATVPDACDDADLRKLLHHIVFVQRYFLSLIGSRTFDMQVETQVPTSLPAMVALFDDAHRQALDLLPHLDGAALERPVVLPRLPGFAPAAGHLVLQLFMHSEHHRAQCATMLRHLGGSPPVTDYLAWVKSLAGQEAKA